MFLPKNKSTKSFAIKVILALILCLSLFFGFAVFTSTKEEMDRSETIEQQTVITEKKESLHLFKGEEDDHTAAKSKTQISGEKSTGIESGAESQKTMPSDSTFCIYFLDVGQADFAVVECDGHYMTIDGGNADDSQYVYSFLEKKSIDEIDYAIVTHAHEDHCGAVAAILNHSDVGVIYCPVTTYSTKTFSKMVETITKKGKSITVPQSGDTFALGSAEVQIIGPVGTYSNTNDTSIVLRIDYGDTSYLFTGDAGMESEKDIIDAGYNVSADVLKVGHHGSDTATSYIWLRTVAPTYAVISSNKEQVPEYGHPDENTISRLRDADVKVYRTDMQGSVTLTSDGKDIDFSVEKNPDADTLYEVH